MWYLFYWLCLYSIYDRLSLSMNFLKQMPGITNPYPSCPHLYTQNGSVGNQTSISHNKPSIQASDHKPQTSYATILAYITVEVDHEKVQRLGISSDEDQPSCLKGKMKVLSISNYQKLFNIMRLDDLSSLSQSPLQDESW